MKIHLQISEERKNLIMTILDAFSLSNLGLLGIGKLLGISLSIHMIAEETFFYIGGVATVIWLVCRAILSLRDLFKKEHKKK